MPTQEVNMKKQRAARLIVFGAAVAAIIALGTTALAHHSTAAFNNERVVRIEGTITEWRFMNPHSSFKLEGQASGEAPDGLWTVEMTAANVLRNQGWSRGSLSVGDSVTVFVHPLRDPVVLNDGSHGGLYVGAILADGTELGRVGGATED
jgi:hypothetical protein